MEYGPSDSSGTDDDLPPSHQNRGARGGHIAGNGRSASGPLPYPREQTDMETQIHWLEQEAYSAVLRAFKAQSDAITWDKESLITELRKELRVSDEEHRELLNKVNADDIIRRIREWRQAGGLQSGLLNNVQPAHDSIPSPKRQKTSQPIPSISLGAPSPALHSQPVTTPISRGPSSKGKKPKSALTGVSTMKSLQIPSVVPSNRSSSGALAAARPARAAAYNPLIGRKVWTRWPADNNYYEAVVTDYNAQEGRHALVYDINTMNETWEWVDLKEIPPEDIRWDGEDSGISRRTGPGMKKPMGPGGAITGPGRGRGPLKNPPNKDLAPSTNGAGRKRSDEIEILHTETLMKEVERVFAATQPDVLEIEKAKKLLREHEQALVDAIARLAEASDGESEEGDGGHQDRMAVEPAWS